MGYGFSEVGSPSWKCKEQTLIFDLIVNNLFDFEGLDRLISFCHISLDNGLFF